MSSRNTNNVNILGVHFFFMTAKYSSDVFSVVLVIYSYVVTGSVAIPAVDQQVNDDSNGLCSGRRHRRKYWLADDDCNECKCTKPELDDVDNKQTIIPVVSCTNLWCGPTFNDCLSGVLPCTGSNQVTYVLNYNLPIAILNLICLNL